MRHKKFTLVLIAFLLLALYPYHSDVSVQESKPYPSKSKPYPSKVIRLIVEEDYGKAEGVRLPIKKEVSRILSRVGAKVVDESASTYDATLTVKIKGEALGENYTPGGYLYTGASLSGEVVLEVGKEVHRFKLEGHRSPPRIEIFMKGQLPERPSDAPFEDVLEYNSNFYTILGRVIWNVYSPTHLIDLLLKDTHFDIREAAAKALGEIKDPRAVEPLIALLKDQSGRLREVAANALGEIKDPRAVEPLIAALKHQDDRVREAAAKALGEIKDPRAVEPLIAALKDGIDLVRKAAAEALDKLNWKPKTVDEKVTYHIAKEEWQECVKIGAPAVEPLVAALKDQHWNVRRAAAKALGEIKDPRAVEPLIAALKDQGWWVRQAAANALDKLNWKPKTVDEKVAYHIAKGDWQECVKIGAPAVEPLIAALRHQDWNVRQGAADALGEIKDPRAVEPLKGLAEKDSDPDVRRAAKEALKKIKRR